jgi:hypothetical protein
MAKVGQIIKSFNQNEGYKTEKIGNFSRLKKELEKDDDSEESETGEPYKFPANSVEQSSSCSSESKDIKLKNNFTSLTENFENPLQSPKSPPKLKDMPKALDESDNLKSFK